MSQEYHVGFTGNRVSYYLSDSRGGYQPVQYEEIMAKSTSYKTLLAFTIICLCLFETFLFLVIGIILLVCLLRRGKPRLVYDMDTSMTMKYKNRLNLFMSLNSSDKLWEVLSSYGISGYQKKVQAGADQIVRKKEIKIKMSTLGFVSCKESCVKIKLNGRKLYVLPEKFFFKDRHSKFQSYYFDEVEISTNSTRFIESLRVPRDATVIDYTWEKVNKNGSADQRFKYNRKLPICNYGEIHIRSGYSMDITLSCSNYSIAQNFAQNWRMSL